MRAFERITRFTPGDAICDVATSTTKWFFVRTSSATTGKNVQAACGSAWRTATPPSQNPAPPAHPSRKAAPHVREAARSSRPTPDARLLPPRRHPAAPAWEEKREKPLEALRAARTTSTRTPRPPAPPCNPLAVSAPVCAPVPADASTPYPSSASVGFRSSGSPSPRPTLPPFAFPSQPPPLVGFVPLCPQRPSHRAIASRRCLSCPSYVPPARDAPLPAACRLLPFLLHPSASARLFLRAVTHALRPCRTDRSP